MEDEKILTEDRLHSMIAEQNFNTLLEFIEDEQNREIVEKDALNIVSILCSALKENEEVLQDVEHFCSCSNVLEYLAQNGNAKEVLMGLLESADSFKTTEFFNLLLQPIQKVLMRIPGKRGKSLDWVLDVLSAHLMAIPFPENTGYEEEELLLLDLDENVLSFSRSLDNFLHFLSPFVKEVSMKHSQNKDVYYSDRITSQREILLKCHLKLLEPMVYHDLHTIPDRQPSSIQASSRKLLSNVTEMCANLFVLTKLFPILKIPDAKVPPEGNEMDTFNKVPVLAFANLAYLTYAEDLCPNFHPYVYSHPFLFETHFHYVFALLEKTEELALYKGLMLCDALIRNVEDLTLPGEFLDVSKLFDLSNLLCRIAIFCEVNKFRTMAITIINTYSVKFNWEMRYRNILCIMNTVDHAGAQGMVVTFYKNFLLASLKDKTRTNYFIGRNLKVFLNLALRLEDGAETDLLENFDRIVCGLNLLRFISIWDKKEANETGLWYLLDLVNDGFLKPLSTGVKITRAHYNLEANHSKDQKRNKSVNATLMVNGENLSSLPPQCKIDVINRALLSLDVIEGLVIRLQELMDQ